MIGSIATLNTTAVSSHSSPEPRSVSGGGSSFLAGAGGSAGRTSSSGSVSGVSPIGLFASHHRFQSLGAQIEPIRPARQLCKTPFLIKRFCRVVNSIDNYCDERKGLSGLVAVAQGLRKKIDSQSLSLVTFT